MIDAIATTMNSYWAFYTRFFSDQWTHLSPVKYGTLLIGIGIFGWVLMKAANKR
jgi:hypothetical protein